jgi:lactose/L-arabinose transport system ATP-binding protein
VRLPAPGTPVTLGLRPEHLSIGPGAALRVDMAEALGGVSYAYLTADSGERIIVEERGDARTAPGGQAGVAFDPARAYLFDAKTGARLR